MHAFLDTLLAATQLPVQMGEVSHDVGTGMSGTLQHFKRHQKLVFRQLSLPLARR